MARHSLPRGHHVRHALPLPVTRHALEDDALVVAGCAPVRRGIAVVAVVGGALSATGSFVATPAAQPRPPADSDPTVIGLAAQSVTDREPVQKHDDLADQPLLDAGALAENVHRAGEEGRRLAADREARDRAAAADVVGATRGAVANGTASMPGELIDTNDWYLTLPTGKPGKPDLVDGSQLATYHSKFFDLNQQRNGIVFRAGADGVTTKNSHYPRSELREMTGGDKASWSNSSGTHVLDVREAFTKLPDAKPQVVGAQIHDANDDVVEIRLEGQKLIAQYHDGKSEAVLDPNYQLGTPYDLKIVAEGGKVDVLYNGAKKAELPLSGSGWYYKVGAYVQSNGSHGDGPGAEGEGEVQVFKCDVQHSGGATADRG